MRSISRNSLIEDLCFILEKSDLVMKRNESILSYNDFLTSPQRMEKLDAACMLIQVIGETAKQINDKTFNNLFSHYPEIYWRGIFGCRNIISHEYGNVDPEQIFIIIKEHLPELNRCINKIIADLNENKYPELFE